MHTRLAKPLLSLAAIAALATPGVALARQGSDDPVNHVRREHHQRHLGEDHRRGADDGAAHARGGRDDGPNHR
jgi:hypothetical protein